MKAELLAVPLKKSSDVDILKPLKNLITSRYQTNEQESYISAINEFSKLRTNSVCRNLDYNENSLEQLCRYYDQIVALETKIPANEIQVPFKWRDAFDKGSIFGGRISLVVSSLSYEKVCVLFNIAALQSQVACCKCSDSDDALKLAAKLLQSSAGVFNHLKTIVNSSVQQEPTPDLQIDTLNALSALMLAQAQEVVTVKAMSDNMKDSILAKLCAQCDEMYTEALKLMQKEVLKPLWDKDWVSKVAGKQAAYVALAYYHKSRECNTEKIIGEEIARLKYALELFKYAQTHYGDSAFLSEEMGRAQQFYNEAVKDNDFIYHERIPEAKNLIPIGKATVAKLAPLPERFSSSFTDLFELLMPVAVQQALVQYDVRKQELVNGEISKLRDSTQLLNSILASLNLPAAIEDTSGEKVPQSVNEKSRTVCEKGGIQSLKKLIEELPELLKRNKELLDECERQLQEEKDSDDQLRAQFKEKWTRTSSDKLTGTFLASADKYRKVINTAVEADKTINQKFETHREGIELLSQGPEGLAAALPRATLQLNSSGSPAVERLRQLMEDVETLKAERDVIESELKSAETSMKDQFLNALAQDGAINEPAMSVENLGQIYGSLQKQVKGSLECQEALVAAIQTAHTQFSQDSGSGGEREALLKKLASSSDAFNELTENLKEGTKFYNDLTQLLVTFQSKISDFCFARKTEKEELLKDLTQGYAYQGAAETPTPPTHHQDAKVPPPRPPPPQGTQPFAPAEPVAPPRTHRSAPPAPSVAYAGAPPATTVPLPYPLQPQGMPAPQVGYPYQPYPVYTPMPQGYNPYLQQQAGAYGSYAAPYPPQPYPGYPYPQQPQAPQWPSQP